MPTPVGEPAKVLPKVDINKIVPPTDEEMPPAQPETPPAQPAAPPSAPQALPGPAMPESSPPILPSTPSGNEGILPPGTAAPEALPGKNDKPAAEPEVRDKQSGLRMPSAAPLFPVESSAIQQPQRTAGGLAGLLVAPSQPEATLLVDEMVPTDEVMPSGEAVATDGTPPVRMLSSATGAEQPAPDRLSRGIWDIRERALTVPVGYAEATSAASIAVEQVSVVPQPKAEELPADQLGQAEVGPSIMPASPSATTAPQLEGLCPVEMVEHGRSVQGTSPWAVQYRGLTFFCAGAEQQRHFQAHPERYLPAFGGRDAVLRREQRNSVAGRSDFWALYEGRLYWFIGETTLAQFRRNPALYAETR